MISAKSPMATVETTSASHLTSPNIFSMINGRDSPHATEQMISEPRVYGELARPDRHHDAAIGEG